MHLDEWPIATKILDEWEKQLNVELSYKNREGLKTVTFSMAMLITTDILPSLSFHEGLFNSPLHFWLITDLTNWFIIISAVLPRGNGGMDRVIFLL